jgi:type IV secretory pathway VirB2 component (pilin)
MERHKLMKNLKIKLSLFFIGITLAFIPFISRAQQPSSVPQGGTCRTSSDCAFSATVMLLCDSNHTCQPSSTNGAGQPCDNVLKFCDGSQGLTCDSIKHVCVSGNSSSGGDSGNGFGSGSNGNNSGSGSNPICDTANGYTMQNGLCIPKSPFSGGLASQSTLSGLITTVINIVLTLSGVIAVIFIIIGGFQYMTARGNEEQAEKGRKALVNAIIGLLIIILAFTIVTVVSNALTSSSVLTK